MINGEGVQRHGSGPLPAEDLAVQPDIITTWLWSILNKSKKVLERCSTCRMRIWLPSHDHVEINNARLKIRAM
jgi:hypothetical protein